MPEPRGRLGGVAVLGFRPHTYWTAAVALVGPPDAPHVVERRRIDFAAGDERSVYHQAEELGGDEAAAEALIARVWTAVLANATRGVGDLARDLAARGFTLGVAVAPIGRGKQPDRLADVLKSHSHIHAAEGDFYRAVVAQACADVGLEVRRAVERDLAALVCRRFQLDALAVDTYLSLLRTALGPPWTEDQKLATLAAWSGMEEAG
ncbi:MAG TPA: hypothetical protein VGG29_00785 [Caulobacteraceae bacterium]|jgi:hypothetical protein